MAIYEISLVLHLEVSEESLNPLAEAEMMSSRALKEVMHTHPNFTDGYTGLPRDITSRYA